MVTQQCLIEGKTKYFYLKGALCSYGKPIQTQHLNIKNSNEVIIQMQKYSFDS